MEVTDSPSGDLIRAVPVPAGAPCSSSPGFAVDFSLVSGDLVVHDAQPFPTSKDQCKNGGWRNFGSTFKNQGQCVSFVATGGKKQP